MKDKLIYIGIIVLAVLVFGSWGLEAIGSTTFEGGTQTPSYYKEFTLLNATTTTATSTDNGEYFVIAGAKRVVLYFSRGDATGTGNTGSSEFSIEVTPDGTNWYDYDQLQLISYNDTSAELDTRVGSSTISAATSTLMYRMDSLGFYGLRCVVVETTDGEHTCKAGADF